MKISTKGRYGLIAMVELANNYIGTDCLSLKHIAREHNISEGYLEQLVAQLKRSGLVKAVRGAHGGYALNKPPAEITIGEVLRTLEGQMSPAGCVGDDADVCPSGKCSTCATKPVWEKMFKSMNDVVDSITLWDLISNQKAGG